MAFFKDLKVVLTKEELGIFTEEWIKTFGKEFSKENPNIFLKLSTVKQFFAKEHHCNIEDIEIVLKNIKSIYYDKYNILGFYQGKVIYRSKISTDFSKIVRKIINKINIKNYKEGTILLDTIENYVNKLPPIIKFV